VAASERLVLRGADLHWRELGDEIIILDHRDDSYLVLNESAMVLWSCLTDGSTEPELTSALAEAYPEAPADQIDADVAAFIARLDDFGLLDAAA
jgi:Coenzyme PQQ synthesis protein D (PqqD)